MNLADRIEIEKTVEAIENVAGGAKIRALDIFFSHKYPDPIADGGLHATTISFGDAEYLSEGGVLENFLLKYGTLSLSKESVKEFREIGGKNKRGRGDKIFKTLDAPRQTLRPASLDELANHLADCHFGKSFALYTIYHPVRSIEVYLSVFAVFDKILDPTNRLFVSEIISWWMLKDVSNLITELLSTESVRMQEEISRTDALVKVVRHMIKNVPLNANLMALKRALSKKDVAEAIEIYHTIARREKLREIITDILYGFKLDPKELRMHRWNFTKYTTIIDLMISGYPDPQKIFVEGLTGEIEHHAANPIPIHQSIDVLTVLVNIWANAIKGSGAITIQYQTNESSLVISFVNQGQISEQAKAYINRLSAAHSGCGEGLDHIRRVGDRNPQLDIQATSDNDRVRFTLRITP